MRFGDIRNKSKSEYRCREWRIEFIRDFHFIYKCDATTTTTHLMTAIVYYGLTLLRGRSYKKALSHVLVMGRLPLQYCLVGVSPPMR